MSEAETVVRVIYRYAVSEPNADVPGFIRQIGNAWVNHSGFSYASADLENHQIWLGASSSETDPHAAAVAVLSRTNEVLASLDGYPGVGLRGRLTIEVIPLEEYASFLDTILHTSRNPEHPVPA